MSGEASVCCVGCLHTMRVPAESVHRGVTEMDCPVCRRRTRWVHYAPEVGRRGPEVVREPGTLPETEVVVVVCPKCGADVLSDETRVCRKCGTKFRAPRGLFTGKGRKWAGIKRRFGG